MSVTVTTNAAYRGMMKRISNLPQYSVNVVEAGAKKHAINVIKEFQNGIKNNTLGLDKLADLTVSRKKSAGMTKPQNPLYGEGMNKDNTYYYALRIKAVKQGRVQVVGRQAKHWKADLTLAHLLAIHEYGVTIITKTGQAIIVPPRPALKNAFEKVMKKLAKGEVPAMRKAIASYVQDGREQWLMETTKQNALYEDDNKPVK